MKFHIGMIGRKFKQTTQKKFAFDDFAREIERGLSNAKESAELYYFQTFSTWTVHPNVIIEILSGADGFTMRSHVDSDVWNYLDAGTEKRWAVMTQDYQTKSVPKSLNARPGYGSVRYKGQGQMKSKGYDDPKPGISAREWTPLIYNMILPEFRREIKNAVQRGSRKIGLS
ncbi:MAG: hypothetical protein HPY87_08955 [Fervidobacterium sp.]|uniref:hypothetical protein n=1 Tax=Fervidobacterium sp. TaxID=1871331 RepID=UPI0025C6D5B1|nr:hypothetical protein [Fervidobacterium sp.]NPU89989.1 hypothetical protein [Fervidobacterium sp.]